MVALKNGIYMEFIAEGFTSLGKNKINHQKIEKTFENKKTNHYAEIYSESYGYSVHLYGEGFMNGYYPTVWSVVEQKDVKGLRSKIKKVFSSIGVYKQKKE